MLLSGIGYSRKDDLGCGGPQKYTVGLDTASPK